MNTEMIKDPTIESAFRRYFAGLEAPKIDLTAAKAALAESVAAQKRGRRKKRVTLAAVLSACACVVLVVLLGVFLLPALLITRYELADATPRTLSFSDFKETYGQTEHFTALSRFSLADNASAEYTVYTVDGKEVMLGADLSLVSGLQSFKATVYIDLSGGKYLAEEMDRYQDLPREADRYRYQTEYLNGEYVSHAVIEEKEGNVYAEVSSRSAEALSYFMSMLTK